MFWPGLDSTSIARLAASCARRGFRPVFVAEGPLIVDRFKDDPNLVGMVGAANVFPWFQSGTPATDEYQAAVKRFGDGISTVGGGPPLGWVSGKLFQKAAANLPEPPTTEAVLKGLWSIRDDTLGRLTGFLTFTEGQLPPRCSAGSTSPSRIRRGSRSTATSFSAGNRDL